MSDRVAACGAPRLLAYAAEPRRASASGGCDEDAPAEPGPAPDSSRGPPAVAERHRYWCPDAPDSYESAPDRREFAVREAMPTFHYKAASAPPEASCGNYEISEEVARSSTYRGLGRFVDPDEGRSETRDGSAVAGGELRRAAGGRSPGGSSAGERDSEEFQNCNGGIDYQFLEQNISHQSILNESISILNRQVSARSGSSVNSVRRLVRTAEGVVLAVVPTGAEVDAGVSERGGRPARLADSVTVPLGWRRIVSGSSVVYISPSGCALAAHAQLRDYLQTPGTCKCGLQCPLRPESAFSFDPKVASKPYQVPPGGDLTKLCNHKRKLLAALQGAQPATPSPHQLAPHLQPDPLRKGMAVEAPTLKKKVRKRQAGVSMSQLLAQRERAQQALPLEYKGWLQQQDMSPDTAMAESRTMSPHAAPVRNCSQSCPPAINVASQHVVVANTTPSDAGDIVPKPEVQPNLPGSHYLTVNSGCINQPTINPVQRIMSGAAYQHTGSSLTGGSPALNIGQPVLGTNGQIIGVHTGGTKLDNQMRNLSALHQQQAQDRSMKQEEERSKLSENIQQQVMVRQGCKLPSVEDGAAGNMNLFCGLNQVPPEVVQKIDQQQQIFIQQNQKQIQMAMKGIRAQAVSDNSSQAKNVYQNQQVPQGQLVIQNGTVMKANPAKTPPWQVKRTDTGPSAAIVPSLSIQHQRLHNITSDQSSNNKGNTSDGGGLQSNISRESFQILQSFEQSMNQMVHSRVPPLHMNYQQTIFTNETKKKAKQTTNKGKKKMNVIENRNFMYSSNGMRVLQDSKMKPYEYLASNPSPSFMDDPSGYLAQQTALLNNTISRQVSSSITFETCGSQGATSSVGHGLSNQNIPIQSMSTQGVSTQGMQNQVPHNLISQSVQGQGGQSQVLPTNDLQSPGVQSFGMEHLGTPIQGVHNQGVLSSDVKLHKQNRNSEHIQQYKNKIHQHMSPLQNNIPDSSVLSEKQIESGLSQCCKGCTSSVNFNTADSHSEPQMRMQYNIKQQMYQDNVSKMETDTQSQTSSPNHSFDDNPVTSSTFVERVSSQPGCVVSDNRGPIQGGTVSTSHVSPPDTLPLPEPSPTPSNGSRGTDTATPLGGSFPQLMASPARSNPATPTPGLYSSPGALQHSMNLTGSQMINFISNHNVNKNLMEVENISFSGANAVVKDPTIGAPYRNDQKRILGHSMLIPGYCPPPHLGGGPSHSLTQTSYVQSHVTTMASGHSVIRDTITSVLAGKAQTATTSINGASANFGRRPQPPNLSNSYAIPPNHPDPFLNSVNLPTSYPLHIAGTVAQNIINRTPLEMVQSVVSNIPMSRQELTTVQPPTVVSQTVSRGNVHSGQILISSTGQIIVPNQGSPMPPPAPKSQSVSGMSPIQSSSIVTNVSASVTQVIPAVGGVQQVINQPAVLVNTLPTPFVLQPQMMTVDGQVMQQNAVLPQIVTGGLVPQGQSSNDSHSGDAKSAHGLIPRVAMLSPESTKKKGKKRKSQGLTNVLHIAAPQQNTGGVLLHHASPQHHTSPQFSPRGFQLSPNSMSPAPMLQALTIVPGKSGTPAHILMNGQGCANNFGSQQIITNTSPTQQINLLQPVNLINNASGVVPNFPTFQQFIVPNIGGMVMTADGTAIIQDSSTGMPMQLQFQNVNGQNVLTPIQNQNVLTTGGNTGVVIRTQNPHGKIIQSQHSPGAQFLSPNSHIMMNSPTFSGQLSPLIANVSPTSVTFNTSPHQVRSANMQQQDLIQCNQMGQTLMVPLSPKPITTASNRSGSTFVQQNTTIVQHQTTLVSNSTGNSIAPAQNVQGGGNRLSIDPTVLFNHSIKQNHHKSRSISIESQVESIIMPSNSPNSNQQEKVQVNFPQMNHNHNHSHRVEEQMAERPEMEAKGPSNQSAVEMGMGEGFSEMLMGNGRQQAAGMFAHVRHSVSTQTLVNQQHSRSPPVPVYSSSPPDTTTHSPLGPLEHASSSPRLYSSRSISMQGNYADTTTKSPEPVDSNSSAMVQCVSSSEPDMPDSREGGWLASPSPAHATPTAAAALAAPPAPAPASLDHAAHQAALGMMGGMAHGASMRGHHNMFCSVESSDALYNQTISVSSLNNQHSLTITPTSYCDRPARKRRNHFADPAYGPDKMMRSNYSMLHGDAKDIQYGETDFNNITGDKQPKPDERHFLHFDNSSDDQNLQKGYKRRNSHSENEPKADGASPQSDGVEVASSECKELEAGSLVWGPAKGYPSWPGKLVSRHDEGKWLVRWFGGDKLPSLLEPARLLTLSEGLEAHHAARTKCRKSRKLNTRLEKAIQEAMSELDKMSTGERCAADSSAGGRRGARRPDAGREQGRAARSTRNAPGRLRSSR